MPKQWEVCPWSSFIQYPGPVWIDSVEALQWLSPNRIRYTTYLRIGTQTPKWLIILSLATMTYSHVLAWRLNSHLWIY